MYKERDPGNEIIIDNLVKHSTYEVFPDRRVLPFFEANQMDNHTVAVTVSTKRPIEVSLEIALNLADLGHKLMVHLPARSIRDIDHLEEIVEVLDYKKIRNILVIGGDSKAPIGEFDSAMQVLRGIRDIGVDFDTVEVAAYPEGFELIPTEILDRALMEKQEFAQKYGINMRMVTQMCFNPIAFEAWLKKERARGITLPVVLGSAGPVNLLTVANFAAKIGFTESAHFLRKIKYSTDIVASTLGSYDPNKFLGELSNPNSLQAMRIFTFNDLQTTHSWTKDFANKKPGLG